MLDEKVKRAIRYTIRSMPYFDNGDALEVAKLIEKASNRIHITERDQDMLDAKLPYRIDPIYKLRQYMFRYMMGF